MTAIVPDAVLTTAPDLYQLRNRAQTHALSFLSRYRNACTRRGYETTLRQWFTWCEAIDLDPLDAQRHHLELFARELEATGRKVTTIASKLNALAGYYRFAQIDGLIDANPMIHVMRPTIERVSSTQGLTRTEFADVLRVANGGPPRDHALICLLGINGMRVSEACGIDIEDLDCHQGQRTVRILRKGGKIQILPLAPRTAWQVEQTMGDRVSGPLLLTRDGHRLDRKTAGRIVARIVLDAGIRKRITPHSLRHTFVTMALDAGQAERDIAISTGHADSRMVAYYDRGRASIARNSTNAVAAWVEGAL